MQINIAAAPINDAQPSYLKSYSSLKILNLEQSFLRTKLVYILRRYSANKSAGSVDRELFFMKNWSDYTLGLSKGF